MHPVLCCTRKQRSYRLKAPIRNNTLDSDALPECQSVNIYFVMFESHDDWPPVSTALRACTENPGTSSPALATVAIGLRCILDLRAQEQRAPYLSEMPGRGVQ